MKNITRAEVLRRVDSLGIIDAGPRENSTKNWPLVDPWGDVTFYVEGCRVTVWCRDDRRRASGEIRVMATINVPQSQRLSRAVAVARAMAGLFQMPCIFEAAQKKLWGALRDNHVVPANGRAEIKPLPLP